MRSAWQASTTDVSGVWSQSLNHSVWQGAFFYIKNVYKKNRFKVFFSSSPVLLQHPHNTESNASHRQTPHVQHICDDLLLLDLITGLSIAAVTLASRKYRHPHIHEPNKQNKQQIDMNVSLLAHYIFS